MQGPHTLAPGVAHDVRQRYQDPVWLVSISKKLPGHCFLE